MSNISTTYDAIIARLAVLFPTKLRIPNAYSETDNAVNFLRDGYCLRYDGDALNPGQFNTISADHTFTVVFTRELLRLDSEVTKFDTIVKDLLESASYMKKDFYDAEGITTKFGGGAERVTPLNTSAITQVYGEKNNFFKLEVSFSIIINELYPCP